MRLEEVKYDKLWVDDFRNPPEADGGYVIARTYAAAIKYLDSGTFNEVFLDHDLGDFDGDREHTGYDVLMHIVQMKMDGKPVPTKYTLLTANPVGRDRMQGVIARYLSS